MNSQSSTNPPPQSPIRDLLTGGTALVIGAAIGATAPNANAQAASVAPGINAPFQNPDIKEWVTRFEGESRETFEKRAELVAACGIKPGMVVADVGAGTGLYTRLFAHAVGEQGKVLASDTSQKFLDHITASAREIRLTNIRTILGRDDSAELPPASADLVFICDTYHHFEYPLRMMRSIAGALRPGGRVIVVDFIRVAGVSSEWVMGHVRAGQEIVEREIIESGFRKTQEMSGLLKDNYLIVFEKQTP